MSKNFKGNFQNFIVLFVWAMANSGEFFRPHKGQSAYYSVTTSLFRINISLKSRVNAFWHFNVFSLWIENRSKLNLNTEINLLNTNLWCDHNYLRTVFSKHFNANRLLRAETKYYVNRSINIRWTLIFHTRFYRYTWVLHLITILIIIIIVVLTEWKVHRLLIWRT